MVVNAVLAPVSCTAGTVPAFPAVIGTSSGGTAGPFVTSTSSISYTNNTVSGVCTRYTYTYVDANDNVLTVGAAATNFIRYCEYPGSRLFAKVKFEVNGRGLIDKRSLIPLKVYVKTYASVCCA